MKRLIIVSGILFLIYGLFFDRYYPNEYDCIRYSSTLVGNSEYKRFHKMANDSLKEWVDSKLYNVRMYAHDLWQLDTIHCFNPLKDKMIGAILDRNISEGSSKSLDDIYWFYGVKIKGKWYFFLGPDLTLIRSNYQSNSSVPLSFAKLHELAVKHIFRGYLYQNLFDKIVRPNHWNINEEFFSDLTSVAWGYCQTQECWDKRYLEIIKENWSKTDTTHYDKDK